jgi:hypothetical protein
VGFYIATPNSKKTVLDAIEDTLVTEVDMIHQKEENHILLEAVGGSVQKQEAELAYKAKSPPVVQIDPMPNIMGKRLPTACCKLINDWLNDCLPPLELPTPSPTSTPFPHQNVSPCQVSRSLHRQDHTPFLPPNVSLSQVS